MEIFSVKNLSFTYPQMQEKALDNVNFTVKRGEFCVICGQSGCGKTTLLRLLKPQAAPHGTKMGEIFFCSENIEKCSAEDTAFKIGYVSQNPENQTVTDTVLHELAFTLENMGMSSEEINIKISETATYFGLSKIIEQKTNSLSGGQMQILNLAAASVAEPDVLILDEPASQLDPVSAENFFTILDKLNKDLGITVIITEHRLEKLFPVADRIIVMEQGKIITDTAPKDTCNALSKISKNHPMMLALPVPARLYSVTDCKSQCPVTVKEGRELFAKYSKNNSFTEHTLQNNNSDDEILSVKNVYFRYDKKSDDVLLGLNLSVNRGEIFSVVGANGSGKSTLLSVIGARLKPYRGKVKLNEKTATMPQNPQLLFVKDSLLEDFKSVSGDLGKINKLSEKFNVHRLLNHHPYDLSGGEIQRAGFVKLLLLEPKILLLDEPTKGCDSFSKAELAKTLKELSDNQITILLVTHDLDFSAEVSTVCAMLFNGTLSKRLEPHEFYCGKRFYTTSANKISRGIKDGIITTEELISAVKEE